MFPAEFLSLTDTAIIRDEFALAFETAALVTKKAIYGTLGSDSAQGFDKKVPHDRTPFKETKVLFL